MAISENVFCKAPWMSLQNDPRGFFNVCCVYGDYSGIGQVEDGWKAAWNSKKLNEIREGFVKGDEQFTKYCEHCVFYEKLGGSQRTSCDFYDSLVKEKTLRSSIKRGPIFLDLRFSTLCNQSCVMCGPHASSRWASNLKLKVPVISSKPLIELVQDNLKTVQVIRFAGGEPLIVPEHYEILKLLVDAKRTDVELVYNTNLSTLNFKNFNILELWKQFPKKEITISVDATGEKNDYIRFGSCWDKFNSNCREVIKACSADQVYFHPTIQLLNILEIPALFRFVEEIGGDTRRISLGNILDIPEELSLKRIPKRVRETLLKNLISRSSVDSQFIQEQVIGLVRGLEQDSKEEIGVEEIIKYLDWIDSLHGTSWTNVFPEINQTLQNIEVVSIQKEKKICRLV